jgi:hypothetical protein
MRAMICVVMSSIELAAQTPSAGDLSKLSHDLRTAISIDSFVKAADLAASLDEAVQTRYQAWLIRDAGQRVDQVLTWLPANTESFWVNRMPFVVKPDEAPELLYGRPIQAYSTDRLLAVNEGAIYKALGNHTIALVVSAASGISARKDGYSIPSPASAGDVAYFYFFADSVDLPVADESIHGHPVWRGIAKVFSDAPRLPRTEPAKRDDENWIALARPDLLILTNHREMLSQILTRMTDGSSARALPTNLSEWAHVNRNASFWGLRHYLAESKPKIGERGFESADLPKPDGAATGVTVQMDQVTQMLEIDYLSTGTLSQRRGGADTMKTEFQTTQPEAGLWRLISDLKSRFDFPVHFAMAMLGFGLYR